MTRGEGHREKKEIPYGLVHYPAVSNSIKKEMLARFMSDTSTAREKHLYGSRATLAILTGITCFIG